MAASELKLEDLDSDTAFVDTEVPKETRLVLAKQQLAIWNNTAYDARLRYRVSKSLGVAEEAIANTRQEYAQAIQAIDFLKSEITKLEHLNSGRITQSA